MLTFRFRGQDEIDWTEAYFSGPEEEDVIQPILGILQTACFEILVSANGAPFHEFDEEDPE